MENNINTDRVVYKMSVVFHMYSVPRYVLIPLWYTVYNVVKHIRGGSCSSEMIIYDYPGSDTSENEAI